MIIDVFIPRELNRDSICSAYSLAKQKKQENVFDFNHLQKDLCRMLTIII